MTYDMWITFRVFRGDSKQRYFVLCTTDPTKKHHLIRLPLCDRFHPIPRVRSAWQLWLALRIYCVYRGSLLTGLISHYKLEASKGP